MFIKPVKLLQTFISILCLFLYCEWINYYVVQYQCTWPELHTQNVDPTISFSNTEPIHIMALADTHLIGSSEGHWFDRIRREWQMYRSFQTAMWFHKPELVFILGDITDEGYYCSEADFNYYIKRFQNLFAVPDGTNIYAVVGNHDVGFHYNITKYIQQRFDKGFNSTSVQLISLRGNHIVLLNSMALEGDGCNLCRQAELQLVQIENTLKCVKSETNCDKVNKRLKSYSRPIVMQHFPLYRKDDQDCNEPDEAPFPLKQKQYKEGRHCLTKKATDQLLQQLNPRIVLNGHAHHGCTRNLSHGSGIEATLPSFSWRNKDNPSYLLLTLSPNNYAFYKCLMPKESTIIYIYIFCFGMIFLYVMYSVYAYQRWLKYKYL